MTTVEISTVVSVIRRGERLRGFPDRFGPGSPVPGLVELSLPVSPHFS